jgi:hypothetical protein
MELQREDAERVALAGGEPARELLLTPFDQVADQCQQLEKIRRRGLGQNSRNERVGAFQRSRPGAQAPGQEEVRSEPLAVQPHESSFEADRIEQSIRADIAMDSTGSSWP